MVTQRNRDKDAEQKTSINAACKSRRYIILNIYLFIIIILEKIIEQNHLHFFSEILKST